MKKLLKRSKGKKIIACVLAFSVALSALTISFVHADDEFYSGSLNEDVSRGSVIATFEFGTYPQRVVYDEFLDLPPTEEYIIIDETLYNNLVSATDAGNFDEGKFYTYEGVTYLREDGAVYDETQSEFVPKKLFYEMAPIEWQVLKIGKHSDGSDKVVAMTTRALECRPYNNSYNCNYLWDGGYYYDDDYYTGDNLLDENKVNHQYPFLRMYLNSYDIYNKSGTPINFADANEESLKTYSTLSEKELTDEEFYNKGFYEKAFSPSEKEAILLDTNELNIEELDGEVCYDKVRLLSAFEWFDEYSEDYLDEPYPVGIGSKFGFSPLQTAYGVTSNRVSLVTGYAGWCYYGNNVEYVTDVWTKSCGPEHFTVTGSGNIYEGISQDHETGIRPVISIKADYFETNDIKLDIKAAPYSHSEFAGWKVNGTHDDSLTGEVIENVDVFDVHKYMGEFVPERGYTTINETTYSLYHQNDDKGLNHGYITYGSFPQSEITSTSDASLFAELESRLTSDGMTITYEGNKYLREDKDGTPHYFLFEPIKWQILNYDNDEKKLILLSESCIDTSTWNTKSGRGDLPYDYTDDETIMWNGEIVWGDPSFHVEGEKVSYPSLRLYLNSYDTTLDSYIFDGTDKYSLSSLTVTDYSDRPFKEQGFLTKAFTNDEINHLIEESNENYIDWSDYFYEDSLLGEPYEINKDKVRLLSCCEVMDWGEDPESGMILDMYARYGFSSTDATTGPESNRLGYTTNYSEFHFKPNEEAVTYDREYLLPSEYGGRKTIPWWTMSVYEDGHYYGSYLNGSDGSACSYEDTASVFAGIRPLISLDISNLTAMSGDGTINNPYTLGDTCLLRLSSEDTAKGTVSSAGTTQNGSFLEGRFTIHNSCTVVATPKEGYKFDGWYKGQTKVSDNETYTFTLDGNTTLLAKFELDTSGGGGGTSGGGGSGGGGGGAASPKKEPEKKVITFKAFMNGYEDKTFKPGDFVTREEVAVIASRTNADFDELTNYTDDNKYIDTLDRWSKNYLGFTYKKKLLQGYEDGSFHPADKMTRGELATLALNILDQLKEQDKEKGKEEQEEGKSKIVFSDIEGKWYEENVKKLSKEGILNGYEDGTFRGDNYVTRIEVAIVFNKLTERSKDLIKDEDLSKVEELFTDTKKTDWFFSDLVLATLDHEKEEIKEEVKAK